MTTLSLSELIKLHALEAMGAAQPSPLMEATIVIEPPDLHIKLRDNDKLIIPPTLLKCSEALFRSGLEVGDRVMVASLEGGQKYYIFDRVVSFGDDQGGEADAGA